MANWLTLAVVAFLGLSMTSKLYDIREELYAQSKRSGDAQVCRALPR
jgi:hypothetical protein